MEGLLKAPAGLVQRERLLLPLGDVAEPHDEALLEIEHRCVPWQVERGLDAVALDGATDDFHLERLDVLALEGTMQCGGQLDLALAADVVHEVGVDHLAPIEIEHRQRCEVGGSHDAVTVDQHDGFGQLVEEAAHLGLGCFDQGQLVAHPDGLPTDVPDTHRERDDRQRTDDDDPGVDAEVHGPRLGAAPIVVKGNGPLIAVKSSSA